MATLTNEELANWLGEHFPITNRSIEELDKEQRERVGTPGMLIMDSDVKEGFRPVADSDYESWRDTAIRLRLIQQRLREANA